MFWFPLVVGYSLLSTNETEKVKNDARRMGCHVRNGWNYLMNEENKHISFFKSYNDIFLGGAADNTTAFSFCLNSVGHYVYDEKSASKLNSGNGFSYTEQLKKLISVSTAPLWPCALMIMETAAVTENFLMALIRGIPLVNLKLFENLCDDYKTPMLLKDLYLYVYCYFAR